MPRIGGIVNLDAPRNVLARRRHAVPPRCDLIGHAQAERIAARAAAERHRQDPVARLGLVQDRRQADDGRARIGVADLVDEQAGLDLLELESPTLCPP